MANVKVFGQHQITVALDEKIMLRDVILIDTLYIQF
jgi:hypothetical protein